MQAGGGPSMKSIIRPIPDLAITGSGAAYPGRALTNANVYERLLGNDWRTRLAERGHSPDYAEMEWGIRARHWADSSQEAIALASEAAQCALADAGVQVGDIDLLLLATSTPPRITSALAAMVGKQIGATAPCIDIRAGGAGAIDALLTGCTWLAAGCRRVLVVAVETGSPYLDPADLSTSLIFGDGAGALVLEHRAGAPGLLGAICGRSDAPGRPFTVPGKLPPSGTHRYYFQKPDGAYVDALTSRWQQMLSDLREAMPEPIARLTYFVPYSTTVQQVRRAAAALGTSMDRTISTLDRHGCLGTASVLCALHELRSTRRVQVADTVALAAVGGGVSWAALLIGMGSVRAMQGASQSVGA